MLALAFLPEIKAVLVLGALAFTGVAHFLLPRFSDRWLLFSLLSLVAAVVSLFWFSELSPALLFSSGILLAHALLWLSRAPQNYRYWRVGVAFLEIILAAVLAPEAHMFVLIFAFVLISSLALSFGFIERNFSLHQPQSLQEAVPPGFLGSLVILSIGIFLSSLAIFPLLPRSNWGGFGGDWAQSGYRENISFREGSLGWASGETKTVVWLFLPHGKSWNDVIPRGLLRMKTLDWFDGVEWIEGAKQLRPLADHRPLQGELDMIREPLPSTVVPVPYGAAAVSVKGTSLNQMESGEWPVAGLVNKRVEYLVGLGGRDGKDVPREIHRRIPNMAPFPGLKSLANTWNERAYSDEQKISAVMNFLRGFRYELLPLVAVGKGPHPLEQFLQKKAGHCELFATTAAILLRLMGMPSRIVVGFRTGDSETSVLTVKNSDAHAWLEVWLPQNGWVVLDPTPLQARPSHFWKPWEDTYDFVQAYWNRYILSYEFSALYPSMLKLLFLFFAIALLFQLKRFFSLLKNRREVAGRSEIILARKKIDKKLRNESSRRLFWQTYATHLQQKYEQLRFGKNHPSKEDVRSFLLESKATIRAFVATQNIDRFH